MVLKVLRNCSETTSGMNHACMESHSFIGYYDCDVSATIQSTK